MPLRPSRFPRNLDRECRGTAPDDPIRKAVHTAVAVCLHRLSNARTATERRNEGFAGDLKAQRAAVTDAFWDGDRQTQAVTAVDAAVCGVGVVGNAASWQKLTRGGTQK